MTPEEVNGQAETLSLINAELTSRLDRQSDSLAKIDNKAVLVIGYALVAGSFLATRHKELILAAIAFCAFAAAVGFGLAAITVRIYHDIEPRPLFNNYARRSKAETLATMAAMRVKHFEFNERRLKTKVWQWWVGLSALLSGTLLMIAAILVQTRV